jgi:hypothetical protein
MKDMKDIKTLEELADHFGDVEVGALAVGGLEIEYSALVHIYDAGWPLCYKREPRNDLWKSGGMVRQHALATCPDCLEMT